MDHDGYRRCVRCVMDSYEPGISFNASGECNYCTAAFRKIKCGLLPADERDRALQDLVQTIREEGSGKPYDCVIGLSGGIDSTVVAYLTSKLGLRPFAVHLDNGWNSPEAEHNIRMTSERFGIPLHTHVVEFREFADLQRAYLMASVGGIEYPTDHAIRALLYRTAAKQNIRFILQGTNLVTESILARGDYSHYSHDLKNMMAIHRAFGTTPLKTLPTMSVADYVRHVYVLRIKVIPFLNYIDYDKVMFKSMLESELDWQDYGGKHCESTWTRFFQSYILPKKFGVDKRKAHLSSMICSGKIDRDEALEELRKPLYEPDVLEADLSLVLEKLQLTREEFNAIMADPPKKHTDYPNSALMFDLVRVLINRYPWMGYWRRVRLRGR